MGFVSIMILNYISQQDQIKLSKLNGVLKINNFILLNSDKILIIGPKNSTPNLLDV